MLSNSAKTAAFFQNGAMVLLCGFFTGYCIAYHVDDSTSPIKYVPGEKSKAYSIKANKIIASDVLSDAIDAFSIGYADSDIVSGGEGTVQVICEISG